MRASFVPEAVDGVEAARAPGGVKAEEHADERGEEERADGRSGLHEDRPALEVADRLGTRDTERHADRAAEGGEHHGLEDELAEDVGGRGADGHPQADLADALRDRHEHDVHDADAAHEQGDRRDRREQHGHRAGDGAHGGGDLRHVDDAEVVVVGVREAVALAQK